MARVVRESVPLLEMAERRGLIQSAEGSIREMSDFGDRVSIHLLGQIRSSERLWTYPRGVRTADGAACSCPGRCQLRAP